MLTGVFHALSVASRFDVVAAQIPESVTAAILFAQLPVLRTITAPLRKLPAIVALAIASVAGVGAGYALVIAIGNATVGSKISGVQAMWQSLQENPTIALPLALAMTWVPILFGLVIDR